MLIEFSKMHGLGNDFMVVDGVTQKVFFSNDIIKKLADRHFGIGFDQLLLVEPPYDPELDFHYRIFNADGSEVEQCGNGARCFARSCVSRGWSTGIASRSAPPGPHHSAAGRGEPGHGQHGGAPVRAGQDPVPCPEGGEDVSAAGPGSHRDVRRRLHGQPSLRHRGALGGRCAGGDPGTHHGAPRALPERVNVGFMEMVNASEIKLRVFERGVGRPWPVGPGPVRPW